MSSTSQRLNEVSSAKHQVVAPTIILSVNLYLRKPHFGKMIKDVVKKFCCKQHSLMIW